MRIECSPGQNLSYEDMEITKGESLEHIAERIAEQLPFPVYAAMVDHDLEPLSKEIHKSCRVQFRDLRYKPVNLIYQNSLVFLFMKALWDVTGKAAVEVVTSINDGTYVTMDNLPEGEDLEDTIARVSVRMRELVQQNLPIEQKKATRREILEVLTDQGMEDQARALRGIGKDEEVRLYTLEGFSDFFYTYLVPSTGYINRFEVMRYRNGILLRQPQPGSPDDIPDFVDEFILYNALREQRRWNDLLGVRYVADINDKIRSEEAKTMVQLSEALHDKKIVDIADQITREGKRIILILGPSSSGKTTFAKRLSIQLMVNGIRPLYIGTDDYFVEREDNPRDAFGEYDYECIEALDTDLFNRQMQALLSGEEVDMPIFNFLTGKKEYGGRLTRIEAGQPIIIEGIHAFNDKLTELLPEEDKFRIYISPLTQINLDAHNRIPTTDTRLIRRMVRDARTRGHDAATTIRLWRKVQEAETKNIFPYSSKADVFFNSVHVYEMSVLRKHVMPLLETIDRDSEEYYEAHRLLRFFRFVEDLEDEQIIAADSILREFIGGSTYA